MVSGKFFKESPVCIDISNVWPGISEKSWAHSIQGVSLRPGKPVPVPVDYRLFISNKLNLFCLDSTRTYVGFMLTIVLLLSKHIRGSAWNKKWICRQQDFFSPDTAKKHGNEYRCEPDNSRMTTKVIIAATIL